MQKVELYVKLLFVDDSDFLFDFVWIKCNIENILNERI